jgi:hypothetical protein
MSGLSGLWCERELQIFGLSLLEAMGLLDKSDGKNKAPLIKALKRHDFVILADMVERYNFVRPRTQGRQRTPIYALTDQHMRLKKAKDEVKAGKTVKQAAAAWSLTPDVLEDYLANKRGSERRMEERRQTRPQQEKKPRKP